ncbi:folliculin-interacting protein 1 isoform X1 [Culex quinquefasciatus]|uniref:folliculin-interacting protein 1 isoform X1 n=1 Tax=Culex quinquefasciatus TaxID=7176 RepID=UPI0018E30413|nr:folliculin-interacting protein 1 isoform X1 [Culex quinquefasciatus]XP_038119081.1 folliculin-interacting protein 1 isoform X1 [Culex quinquefasciatus]XP_038119082.1 folliculin-interacting protein 1 isoform X1 [Culex quinquefasciatus]XP_038119083.1 folliculin-interacting protein 1 isoform X1 [Culex quinquefasciatus]
MALFNKLFSTGKKRSTSSSAQKCTAGQFPFTTDQIRVILFRECDIRGRKLLFDSNAVERIPDGPSAGSAAATAHAASASVHHKSIPQAQKCDHCKILYQHNTNPKNDIKPLSEMIFGSAPIAFQGSSLKVHWLKMPKTIMCSHVFPTPVRNTASSSSSNKKVSLANYLGSELSGGGGHGVSFYDRHPSVSDLSSMDTNSLRSFTVTSSTSTQHDISYNSRQRPPLPLEFGHLDRLTDPRLSTNSGMDSGYGGTDPWAYSSSGSRHPLSSHRSSLASICSDYECFRRLSTDTSIDIPQVVNCASLDDCSQYGSFHRRVSKNLTTSFENRLTLADHIGHVDDLSSTGGTASSQVTASDGCVGNRNRRNSETVEMNRRKAFSGELLSTATNYQGRPPSKKARLGIALCIQLNESTAHEMEAFCSEHMSIFETMLCRLRVAAENACHRWQQFLQIMLAAWHSTQQWLVDFFTAPRLVNPVWITLSSGVYSNASANWNRTCLTIANDFMNDLCSLLSLADTKDTNLFISTLLTAVLTHHLGWVSTIAPISGPTDGTDASGCSIQREKDKISKITANHPYNVLWAQLGDLYGAVGHPVKLSKTIICGSPQMSNTIEKILNVLSYFIRCSEIKRTVHVEAFEESKVKEAFAAQRIINSASSPAYLSEQQGTSKDKFPKMARTASGMVRSGTIMKDLTAMEKDSKSAESEQLSMLKKNVMNDIPNVLVYRDSRFVQQELRIGNKSMDTELLMNAREKQFLEMIYHIKKGNNGPPIRMTLTQPDETGQEAIELDGTDTDDVESVRLSKLITETNIGDGEHGQRLFWGIERIRNELPMDQLKYIDGLRGDYDMLRQSKPKEDVVFVLGDNEKLVNIRHAGDAKSSDLGAVGGKKPCSHSRLRRHSVIFNFDRYPKVVENYWKSQHLDMTEHGFHEKAMKLDMAVKMSLDGESSISDPSEEECDVCRNASFLYLQTPTNASELEFSYDLHEGSSISSFHNSASKSSLEEELRKYPGVQPNDNIPKVHATAMATLEEHPAELKAKHPDSILKLMDIPMSKAISAASLNDENNNDKTEKRASPRAGFMPSLFSRVSDHYIPDMILQGTTAQPAKWEKALKKDLSFASRFSLMEQYPVENLAVVANLETHDVRLITSHASSLAPISPDGDLVGMSQLVSSMLETVHAMWSSGMSAFQCMAFMESKLRELYLHSETIASFLLATDFCTIGSITSALDITANDMPLLLSVASIHAPEVTKRYGIQFR